MLRMFSLCLVLAGASIAFAQKTLDTATIYRIGRTAYEQSRAPGFSLAVLYKGQVVFANGYGYADLTGRTPVMAGTRFSIGSITKQFTAVPFDCWLNVGGSRSKTSWPVSCP